MNLIKCKLEENEDTRFMNKDIYINTDNVNAIFVAENQVIFTNNQGIVLSDNSINNLINIGLCKEAKNIGF